MTAELYSSCGILPFGLSKVVDKDYRECLAGTILSNAGQCVIDLREYESIEHCAETCNDDDFRMIYNATTNMQTCVPRC